MAAGPRRGGTEERLRFTALGQLIPGSQQDSEEHRAHSSRSKPGSGGSSEFPSRSSSLDHPSLKPQNKVAEQES